MFVIVRGVVIFLMLKQQFRYYRVDGADRARSVRGVVPVLKRPFLYDGVDAVTRPMSVRCIAHAVLREPRWKRTDRAGVAHINRISRGTPS